jgi:hypothetical protein
MEISNLELTERRAGFQTLAEYKYDPADQPEKKAARQLVASRVGRAMRELRNALDTFDERNNEIILLHAKRDSENRPIPLLDDRGATVGIELKDLRAFSDDRKPLLREMVQIPNVKGIDYELLRKADIPVDGILVGQLGDFLEGEPEPYTPPVTQSAS